jgi:NAD dependent epimerase/dehydratase family enzyme
MATILITGGTGMIGLRLAQMLKNQGHTLHLLSRTSKSVKPYDAVFSWDVKKGNLDERSLDDVEVIVHLAGAGIADQRWTDERKSEILSSRIDSAKLILEALKRRKQSLTAFVS